MLLLSTFSLSIFLTPQHCSQFRQVVTHLRQDKIPPPSHLSLYVPLALSEDRNNLLEPHRETVFVHFIIITDHFSSTLCALIGVQKSDAFTTIILLSLEGLATAQLTLIFSHMNSMLMMMML